MKSERLCGELERIRDGLYREQPMSFEAVNSLINLLQYAFCPHEWETKRDPNTPDGPGEVHVVCKKCGAERLDE